MNNEGSPGRAVTLDGGITGSVEPEGVRALVRLTDRIVEAQQERDERLAELLTEAERTCDYRRLDEATAGCNAAANNDLDQLLGALRQVGIGTASAFKAEAAVNRTESDAGAWAAAGYTTADSVSAWTAIGIDTPDVAQQWVRAGFTPESASLWVEVPDMTPSEAATCANGGLTPVDVERIRRADPWWTRPEPAPYAPEHGWGITA
jgi:hypothetical protein